LWYRNVQYEAERARGLDFTEDLAAPGVFTWDLSSAEAVWILSADGVGSELLRMGEAPIETVRRWRATEMSRRADLAPMVRSAGAYLVQRGGGKTIVAGYPWFTDWGRDTFIALRGLCVATGRLDDARDVLLQWSRAVSAGMLPNRYPDVGEIPEYNAVDASLWFIVAVHDFFQATAARRWHIAPAELDMLRAAVHAILDGYTRGTRYGVRCDADGLLAAGESGVPLTWMDAKVGDSAVTPRIGKPVEVQALWLNALRIGCEASPNCLTAFRNGSREFQARFWNERDGYLYDVVDVDHRAGAVDRSFRSNQVLAVGGLPFPLLTGARARRVIDAIEARLVTPMGLRTLAPDDLAYVSHYRGGARDRDGAYHQGTVWPWLIGPFAEGWVRVRGNTAEAKREARARFLAPLLHHLGEAGLGHISEIADGDPPHTPRGCPFQAWSLGEALRLDLAVLAE
jgi:predicted glycogen debranching enzyme